jgi:hypothetical protein
LRDEIIEIEGKDSKITSKVRKVSFYDRENKREFEFNPNL